MHLVLIVGILANQDSTPSDSILTLPLRVHLLRSSDSPALSTTIADSQVQQYLAVANGIWEQAGITWQLESIVREEALNGGLFERVIRRQAQEHLHSFMPRTNLLEAGWNLFLIQDFGQVGGGVFFPEIRGVILAQRGFGFELSPEGRGGATLGHELGHSLGLKHEVCDDSRNIMANACWRPSMRSNLTLDQIRIARNQARLRVPAPVVPGP
jgi:hypothetical protein